MKKIIRGIASETHTLALAAIIAAVPRAAACVRTETFGSPPGACGENAWSAWMAAAARGPEVWEMACRKWGTPPNDPLLKELFLMYNAVQ